jgi:hypothetical protein
VQKMQDGLIGSIAQMQRARISIEDAQ